MSLKKSVQAVFLIVVVLLVSTGVLGASDLPDPKGEPPGSNSPSATASRMGPEVRISWTTSPEANRFTPALAYNWRHREYLVVWHNTWPDGHRDIYARRVSESGKLLSGFAVSAGPNDRAQPAVAYNATNDEYLVTWMYNANGDSSTYEIWGRIVAWNGTYMKPEKLIITYPNRTFWTPRVAWNNLRNEYLVLWSAHQTGTLTPTDVAHALLSANADKLFGTIISSDDQPHQADVAYNVASDEYLVVWRRMWAPADGDIRAARIAAGPGTVVNPPGVFSISDPTEDQLLPSVTTNQQHRYLVVWQHAYPGPCCDWDIRGQELDVNGGLVGSVLYFAASTEDETDPRVAARPGPRREYLVVWQRATTAGEAVRGVWWNGVTSRSLDLATIAFWNAESPAVAAGSPGFLTVYEGDAQGDPTVYRHIYGRRWVPYAVFLPLVVRNR